MLEQKYFRIFMPTPKQIEQAILDALSKSDGYVTPTYLAHVSGSAPEAVNAYLADHPDVIRKSKIETTAGESLYTLNTPLSGIADAWNAFCYVNSKKF